MDEIEQDTSGFGTAFVLAQAAGAVAVLCVGVWMGHYAGGFSLSSEESELFNLHPVIMVLAMVFLYGNGVLIYRGDRLLPKSTDAPRGVLMYRAFRHERKRKLKLSHAVLMAVVFVLALVGLKIVVDFHTAKNIPHFYTLHSWLGLAVLGLFLFQWAIGFFAFLFPGLGSHIRAALMPWHTFFGQTIFVMACATALLGINEKAIFMNSATGEYAAKTTWAYLVNVGGVLIGVFAALVIFLTANPRFKRLSRPEDEMLLQEATN